MNGCIKLYSLKDVSFPYDGQTLIVVAAKLKAWSAER